jgi:uncharacterized membrane protein
MSVSLSDLTTKTRYLLKDISLTRSPGDIFIYGSSSVFTLEENNVISVTTVLVNDVELSSGDWSYDTSTNKVTVTASLVAGDTVEIRYTYYSNYSSNEIENAIQAALVHISANNYKDFIEEATYIFPEPSEREENLIAMVAALILDGDNISYRLPDMSISRPSGKPTHDKISQVIAIFKKNSHGIFAII